MQTTMGEIRALFAHLDVLLARQSLRAADVAVVATLSPDDRRPWYDGLLAMIRGSHPRTANGLPESAASIRARKIAERQGQAV